MNNQIIRSLYQNESNAIYKLCSQKIMYISNLHTDRQIHLMDTGIKKYWFSITDIIKSRYYINKMGRKW